MRIGILSDVHNNAAGLARGLALLDDVDEVLCAGDIVEDYRFGSEAVALLRERGAHCVLGNHDLGLLAPSGARARAAPHVSARELAWLAERPLRFEATFGGLRVLMVHASPCPPHTEYVWRGSAELRRIAEADLDADVVVVGHTHVRMAERAGRVLVVNPGSAGDGRDPADGRRCSVAVLDTGSGEVTFRDYDRF